MDTEKQLRQQLAEFIDWHEAHADLAAAVDDFPAELHGRVPAGIPYSAWQLLEHIRIALWDIVEFAATRSTNRRHGRTATGRRTQSRRTTKRGTSPSLPFAQTSIRCGR